MNIALKLQELLDTHKISRSRLAREIGVHTSTVSNWLDGKDVKSENLATLCTYFECSLDYLTGTTPEIKKAPTPEDEREIGFDDFTYAFSGEVKELTPEDKQLLLSMARQLNQARKQRDGRKTD